MQYKILKDEELGVPYLSKIMEIDEDVYSGIGNAGSLAKMENRYIANTGTFIVLENAKNKGLVGYIIFFQINEKTFCDVISDSSTKGNVIFSFFRW